MPGRLSIAEKQLQCSGVMMIPDYLTFIRFQDKRNILFFYIVTLVLLGFYWRNADFTLSLHDAGFIGGICALVFYNVIFDLKAYWAYKCVIKNIDFSYFKGRECGPKEKLFSSPVIAGSLSFFIFLLFCAALIMLIAPAGAAIALVVSIPPVIYALFFVARHSYLKQMPTSVVEKVHYKNLSQYLLLSVVASAVLSLLTIIPLRDKAQFDLYGSYFTLKSIITMCILCAVVLAVNLLFLCFTKRYVFLGRLFLNEINLFFSPALPLRALHAKPLWQRLILLSLVEFFWVTFLGLVMMLSDIKIWFEVWFLLCYAPCLIYYYYHAYWRWHNDFMMSCDMYLRWDEIKKKSGLW